LNNEKNSNLIIDKNPQKVNNYFQNEKKNKNSYLKYKQNPKESQKKVTDIVNNSNVLLYREKENNSINENDYFENSKDLQTRKNDLKHKEFEKNLGLSDEIINNIRKTEFHNKIISPPEKNKNLNNKLDKVEGNPIQKGKHFKNSSNLENSFKHNENIFELRNFAMGYCDLMIGYILNIRAFRKNSYFVSKKYRYFLKFETNLNSLIDYSNLIKMMIKIKIIFQIFKENENKLNYEDEQNINEIQ